MSKLTIEMDDDNGTVLTAVSVNGQKVGPIAELHLTATVEGSDVQVVFADFPDARVGAALMAKELPFVKVQAVVNAEQEQYEL
jgi:hypothetical protein